jgi:hypothetical protein
MEKVRKLGTLGLAAEPYSGVSGCLQQVCAMRIAGGKVVRSWSIELLEV